MPNPEIKIIYTTTFDIHIQNKPGDFEQKLGNTMELRKKHNWMTTEVDWKGRLAGKRGEEEGKKGERREHRMVVTDMIKFTNIHFGIIGDSTQ